MIRGRRFEMTLRQLALLLLLVPFLSLGPNRADAKKKDAKKNEAKPRTELAAAATPPEKIHVPEGFKVELLYSVPKDEEGSWVNLCFDPKGRLIVSDQYGGLYRITPPSRPPKSYRSKRFRPKSARHTACCGPSTACT